MGQGTGTKLQLAASEVFKLRGGVQAEGGRGVHKLANGLNVGIRHTGGSRGRGVRDRVHQA